MPHQVFLLSPANCAGSRARHLLSGASPSPVAQRLRTTGATIGEVFTYMSALYFRGKLAYAEAFARPPTGCNGTLVIVPGRGLLPASTMIDLEALRSIATVGVDLDDERYTTPLRRDAASLAGQLVRRDAAILLGSLATPKYLGPLGGVLGARLRFPARFIGLGDMSRGSLMLRSVAEGRELEYTGSA